MKLRPRPALVIALGVLVVLALAGLLYVRSEGFHQRVRAKVVEQLEDVTGGRVELRSFTWRLTGLEFVAEDLTIRGLEPPSEKPYAHIDSLKVRVKIVSLMQRQIGLSYAGASRPQFHIIVNPDGTTNQPVPRPKQKSGKSPLDQIFDLAIDRLEVSDGALLWNDRKLPLDFSANNVSVAVDFDPLKQVYSARLQVAEAAAKYAKGDALPLNADVQLELTRNAANIKALRVSAPSSRIEASGRITELNDPKAELSYKLSLGVAELAGAATVRNLLGGHVDIEGTGQAHGTAFATSGRFVVRDLVVRDQSTNLRVSSAASNFNADQRRLSLPNLVAQALGGNLRASIEVNDWLAGAEGPRSQRGRAHMTLSGIDVGSVLSALSTKKMPLDRLNASGDAEGTVIATWRGSPANAQAELDLRVTPPPSPSPEQMPVTARLKGAFDLPSQSLALSAAELSTTVMRLNVSGGLGSQNTELKIALNATSLSELEPMLAAMGAKGRIPVDIKGRATFHGTVRGRLAAPELRGRLEVANFDLLLEDPDDPTKPDRRVHWDSLGLNIDYKWTAISIQNGTLRRGNASITFAGNSTLPNGAFSDASAFSASADLSNASLQDVQSIAGFAYPLTGIVNARVRVQGTRNNMRGEALLTVANGSVYGEPFKNLRADLGIAGQDTQLRSLTLAQNGAAVNARGTYNLRSKVFQMEAHGRDFNLAHIQRLQTPRLSLEGLGNFDATASGTVQNPIVQATLNVRNIVANGEQIGDVNAKAVTRGREMQLSMRSELEQASLAIDGKVNFTDDFASAITVNFNRLDFDPVLRPYLEDRITGHSSMNGKIEISGPLKRWQALRVEGAIPEVTAEIEKITLTNAAPIQFSYANQVATLHNFHLRGEGTDVTATGTVNLANNRIDIAANGDLNLKLGEGFYPGLLSYGTVNMKLAVGGTMKEPAPNGQVTIRDAGVSIIDLPNGLANINGSLIFNENRLQVQTLTAHTGGGTLEIGGFISYQSGVFFDLTAKGREVRLRYPPGISASANADLRYTGTLRSSTLSGEVLVTKFAVNPRFDFALYVARGKAPTTVPKANPLLDNLRLDVRVTSTPELRVETQLAKIAGDADLRIRGTASRPAVLGRVNIDEGDIFFNSTKYRLERGDISFNNPVRIEPILNVEASARVRQYDITIGFHGSVDKLNTTYRSEPPLPTADIIALLALGRTREDAVLNPPAQQNFAETASNAILGQALDAAVSSRVQKLFGVSRIKIDPRVGGPETAAGARITIEQQVNNNVTLTYITNVTRANQQIIQGEFNFTREVSLVVVRDENGVLGFDVRVRQRKK